jgi:hypothetical protein
MTFTYKAGLTIGAAVVAASLFIQPLAGQGGGAGQAPGAGRGQGQGGLAGRDPAAHPAAVAGPRNRTCRPHRRPSRCRR